MITQEQRELRKDGLFSSDVARIMTGHGVSVALEKLGTLEVKDFSDVMEINIGWKAEPLILDAYEQLVGVKIRRNLDTEFHSELKWLGCHRDGDRPNINIEGKTVGSYNRHQWGDGGDEVPDYVLWQVLEQMAVSGQMVTDIPVCFVGAKTLKYLFLEQSPPITIFQVKKDFELEDFLIKKSQNVWNCIQQGITPAPENLNDIKLLYSKATDPAVEATEEMFAFWKELLEVKATLKTASTREDELKFKIQSFMEA